MALQGPIPVTFDMAFPHGCYIVGEVEPVKDFNASTNRRFVQARDKQTSALVGHGRRPNRQGRAEDRVGEGPQSGAADPSASGARVAVHAGRVRPHHGHAVRQPGLLHPVRAPWTVAKPSTKDVA